MSASDNGPASSLEGARDLVISYCFPPYVDETAILAAKRVHEHARPVDVIHKELSGLRGVDLELGRITEDRVVRRHEVPSAPHTASWGSMARFSTLGIQQALAWDREGPGYESVRSLAPFAASHVLAARLRLVRPEVRWTAEFSEPLSRRLDGSARRSQLPEGALVRRLGLVLTEAGFDPPPGDNALEWVEHLAYAAADELVFASEGQVEDMAAAVADRALAARVQRVAVVAPPATLPDAFYALGQPAYELEPGVRHLAYFGEYQDGHGLDSLLEALQGLPVRLADRLRLHLFTDAEDAVAAVVTALGIHRWVRVRPSVPYLDLLALSTRMDVLVLIDPGTRDHRPSSPYVPSRLSDYRGSGVRLWGLTEERWSIDGQPLTYRSPLGHTTAAVQTLAEIAVT